MLPDRVSNPGPLTYESGALPIALRGPAELYFKLILNDLNDPRGPENKICTLILMLSLLLLLSLQ